MRLYTNKNGWEQHINIQFPNYQFWGFLTIMFMLVGYFTKSNDTLLAMQISSTFFILMGIIKFYTTKRIMVEQEVIKK